jgi:hypothetical protein
VRFGSSLAISFRRGPSSFRLVPSRPCGLARRSQILALILGARHGVLYLAGGDPADHDGEGVDVDGAALTFTAQGILSIHSPDLSPILIQQDRVIAIVDLRNLYGTRVVDSGIIVKRVELDCLDKRRRRQILVQPQFIGRHLNLDLAIRKRNA